MVVDREGQIHQKSLPVCLLSLYRLLGNAFHAGKFQDETSFEVDLYDQVGLELGLEVGLEVG